MEAAHLAPVAVGRRFTSPTPPPTPQQRDHPDDEYRDHQRDHDCDPRRIHDQIVRRFTPSAYCVLVWRRRGDRVDRATAAAADLELPDAVFKTCLWQPRDLIETGLRQWLRCCAPALRDGQVIGMPSHAVDEAWHGLILCTARYSAFCDAAYGRFLHHHPEGGAPEHVADKAGSIDEQLRRTVIAWTLVAQPGEDCVLWDLDTRVGVDHPWGIPASRVDEIRSAIAGLGTSATG
jgi:hypothetical protein